MRRIASRRYAFRAWRARTNLIDGFIAAAPGILVVGVLVTFAATEGGFLPVTWYPGLIFAVLLLAAILSGRLSALGGMPRSIKAALILGALFVAWSYASIAWADISGVAWEAANRSMLYFALFATFSLIPWRAWTAATTLGVLGLGLALVGFVVVVKAGAAPDPSSYLIKSRFAEPVGYPNGNAALFISAAVPLLFLGSRAETPWPLRGLTLGAVTVLVQLAVLAQSRGSVLAGGVALILYFIFVPDRARSLVAVLAIAAATVWSLDAQLSVFSESAAGNDVGAALERAADGMARSFVVLTAFGALWGLVGREVSVSEAVAARARRFGTAAIVVAAIGAVAATVAVVGNPVREVERSWEEFTSGHPSDFGSSRFDAGLGSYRSEYWDVALEELGSRPLGGMGAGNFTVAYARERSRATEEPLYAHSLPIEVASQTGIVGAALFGGSIAFAFAAAWGARRLSPFSRGLASSSALVFAYWFLHAAADWFWALPALSGVAFACLGMAAGMGAAANARAAEDRVRGGGEEGEHQRGGRGLALAQVSVVVVTLLILAAAIPPWLAAVEVGKARAGWESDPQRAFDRLERARALNPLSDQPDLLAAAIAVELGDRDRARMAYARAVERAPKSWFAQQQLGIEESLAGHPHAALLSLREARDLNPLEEITHEAIPRVATITLAEATLARDHLEEQVCLPVPTVASC